MYIYHNEHYILWLCSYCEIKFIARLKCKSNGKVETVDHFVQCARVLEVVIYIQPVSNSDYFTHPFSTLIITQGLLHGDWTIL